MIKGRASKETGEVRPDQEGAEPDPLRVIADILDELGPEGVDAIRRLELAERDLRISSTTDPKLLHALERADQLSEVRVTLQRLMEEVAKTTEPSVIGVRTLGGTALRRIPRPRQEPRDY